MYKTTKTVNPKSKINKPSFNSSFHNAKKHEYKPKCNFFLLFIHFRNEVEFYTTIMPELLKFQATKTDEVFNAMPKCFYARSDLLIMGKFHYKQRIGFN